MARHACVIEDWPLPDPDDDEVLEMLPPDGVLPIIAEDHSGTPVGAVWTYHGNPPLRCDAAGAPMPELCIAVAPERRGVGIGGMLLDALFADLAKSHDTMCTNVHVRNPARRLYERKGFRVVGQGNGPLGLALRWSRIFDELTVFLPWACAPPRSRRGLHVHQASRLAQWSST